MFTQAGKHRAKRIDFVKNQQPKLYAVSELTGVSPQEFLVLKDREIFKRESQILRGNNG
jgi:hypothetical protein